MNYRRAFAFLSLGFAFAAVSMLTISGGAKSARSRVLKAQDAPAAVSAPVVSGLAFADLSGKTYGDADVQNAKATVFFFTSTQCPIAGQYVSRMNAFATDYAGKGVRAFVVNSNIADSRSAWAKYAKIRGFAMPVVKDDKTTLADKLGAQMTPSAVVLDTSGAVRYIGRIDDDTDKKRVRRSELKEATEAVLGGQPVKVTRTRPLGCAIWHDNNSVKTVAMSANGAKITYAKDIAPLLNKNCVVCHRKGDVAPFALETYAQARQWAPAIKEYTRRRIMPPWKPIVEQSNWFHDARFLTDGQITSIARWADAGAPSGDLKKAPASPRFHAAGDWPLGKPDAVLMPARPFHLAAEGDDVYRNFTLPMTFDEDTHIAAFDFQPGNRRIVHHIIAYIDVDGKTAARRDNKETEPGWNVSGGGSGIVNDDWGAGWAAGMTARRYEPGVAIRVPKGATLVLQVHYHKSGLPETDQTKLALYFAKTPVTKVLRTAVVGSPWIYIKPGVKDHKVVGAMTLPFAARVREVFPHMHLLGTEMRVEATLPDNTKRDLIYVKNWEFHWQMGYRFKTPIDLPKGTRITVTSLYDNTAENPFQPSSPPRAVRFGEQSNDEMCFAFIGYTRADAGDVVNGAKIGTAGAGL